MGKSTGLVKSQLTPKQKEWLEKQITLIKSGIKTMREVHAAIAEIHKYKYWRDTHHSFPAWCEDVLGITKRTANRWIENHRLVTSLPEPDFKSGEQTPIMPDGSHLKDAHVVELRRCAPEGKQDEVLEVAVAVAEALVPEGDKRKPRLTVKIIQEAAAQVAKANAPKKPTIIEEVESQLPRFASIIRSINTIKNELASLHTLTAGKWLSLGTIKADLDLVISNIKHSAPYCTCVYCGGSDHAREDCTGCAGFGLSPKITYDQATEQQQKAATILKAKV